MKSYIISGLFIVALIGTFSAVNTPEEACAASRPNCSRQQYAVTRARTVRNNANVKMNTAQRKLDSLQRMYDSAKNARERQAEQCVQAKINYEEKQRNQMNRLEDQRRQYIAQAADLAAQAALLYAQSALCDAGSLLPGRSCDGAQIRAAALRLGAKGGKLLSKATLVETRIASLRDNLSRNSANLQAKCNSKDAFAKTKEDRAKARADAQALTIQPLTDAFNASEVALNAAQEALVSCQNPVPTPTPTPRP